MNGELPFADDDVQRLVPGLILLNEEDFTAALNRAASPEVRSEAVMWAPLDSGAIEAGAVIAGRANHPETRGVFARVKRSQDGVSFEGRLFGVLADPAFDETGRVVSARKFRIAAVELRGSASWVGTDSRFSGSVGAVEPGHCCGTPTVCVSPPGGDEPPVLMPTARVGVTTTRRGLYETRAQRDSEAGTVGYTVYGSSTLNPGQPGSFPGGIGPDPDPGPNPGVGGGFNPVGAGLLCLEVLDPACGRAKPLCGPDDIGFATSDDGAADIPIGSSRCADELTRPVRGLNVPEACTYAYFTDPTDPACRGTYGGPPNHGNPFTGLGEAIRDATNSLFCRFARWIPGSGSPCETTTERYQTARNAALVLEFGGVLPGESKTQCTPVGERGIERCVTCTNDGEDTNCSEQVKVPLVDPAVAGGRVLEFELLVNEAGQPVEVVTGTITMAEHSAPAADAPAPAAPPANNTPAPPTPQPKTPSPPPPLPPGGPPRPDPGPAYHSPAPKPKDKKDYTRPKTPKDATRKQDPVELADGCLVLENTDLSFPGPVRPLTFARTYRSRSASRSALGSNWWHNWEVRLQVYDERTIPSWLSPWCGGLPGIPTAIAVHWGDGSSDLFLLDIDTRLFLPQAGTAATVGRTTTGWAMRYPDGRILTFDDNGCLVRDSDRFGNAFVIEWEPTPLGLLFDYFCTPDKLAARNETLAARRNTLLAFLVGAGPRPGADRRGWEVSATDFPMPADPVIRDKLEYARDWLLHLASLPLPAEGADGGAHHRITRVIDAIGRELLFQYQTARRYATNPGPRAFANDVGVGLLESVRGPVGTSVSFTYSRPVRYPEELNESFLVGVLRSDSIPAGSIGIVEVPDRQTEYEYQGPGSVTTYEDFADLYEKRYLDYYVTFVGCRYDAVYVCKGVQQRVTEFAPGDPRYLARLARNAYISDVADNILTVRYVGEIQLETRYPADPADSAFDRAVAQRFGSSRSRQDPARVAPDAPGDAWRTMLPKATIEYCTAGPTGDGGDLTDAFLPVSIRNRYPLEQYEPPPLDESVAPAKSRRGGCDYKAMERLRKELPGWRELVPYFDQPDQGPITLENLPPEVATRLSNISNRDNTFPFDVNAPAARLWRTPLTADQLAGAQLWDPTHNDLLSGQAPNAADPSRPLVDRIVGRRSQIARNNNRICNWAKVTDRDGNITYFGLNYRGQALVEANQEQPNQFVFVDRFYNADGNLVEERRPTHSVTPWRRGDGRTLCLYDEINPTGNRGWNAWIPVFWARRHNLRFVYEEAVGEVFNSNETGGFSLTSGRLVAYRYEPLFNQVAEVMSGSVSPGSRSGRSQVPPTVTMHTVSQNVFDYQELSITAPPTDPNSIQPLLNWLKPWGFSWLVNDPEAFGFQFPIQLLGVDVNGDGTQGNPFAAEAKHRGMGQPILTIQLRPGTTTERRWRYRWSPHGLPARVDGPDGERIRYHYYPFVAGNPDSVLGSGNQPGPLDAHSGNLGFLARVLTQVMPSELAYSHVGLQKVSSLSGPYQFLGIGAATTASSLPSILAGIGLPQEQINDLLATLEPNATAASTTTSVAYNRAGHPRVVFLPTGSSASVTDTDGRTTSITDPRGTVHETTYDLRGRPVSRAKRDNAGNPLAQSLTVFDEEDNILMSVLALVPGAAVNPPPAQNAIIWRYNYTPEGLLERVLDPEGSVLTHRYDPLRRLEESRQSGGPGDETRVTRYFYNVDGRLRRLRRAGTRRGGPIAEQSFEYDGLHRLVTTVDERGVTWQQAWSSRDLLIQQRQSREPYPVSPQALPLFDRRFFYNDFAEIMEVSHNGFNLLTVERSPGGQAISTRSAGIGPSHETADLLGRPTWSRKPDNTETVVTRIENPHRVITSVIRRDATGAPRTTSTIVGYDSLGSMTQVISAGGPHRITTSHALDGLGRFVGVQGPGQEQVRLRRNMAGWVIRQEQLTAPGTLAYEPTDIRYDNLGHIRSISDAAGQVANYEYNLFGERVSTFVNGAPAIATRRTYDRLGRPEQTVDGLETILHRYDARHDPVLDVTQQGVDLTRRTFDPLGRLTRIEYTNSALSWLSEPERTVTTELEYDTFDRIRRDRSDLAGRAVTVDRAWLVQGGSWRNATKARIARWSMEWEEVFDPAGRRTSQGPPARPTEHVRFGWLGDIYSGRIQPQAGWQSAFRESIELDAFLLPTRATYRAIETDAQGNATNANDAAKYAPLGWDPAVCSLPLLDIRTVRDPQGRVALETWRHGHPIFGRAGLQLPKPPRLRAASYTLRGALALWWENDAFQQSLPLIQSYGDPTPTLQRVAGSATQWTYDRDQATDDLRAIRSQTGELRYQITAPRTTAHQLTQLQVARRAFRVRHDAGGRVIADGRNEYAWHPTGLLATVRGSSGALIEGYAYDGFRRLVGLYDTDAPGTLPIRLVHNAGTVIAALRDDKPLWEAMWGPLDDHLIEWREPGSGVSIPLLDARHSPVALWHPGSGAVTAQATYTPEGRISVRDSTDAPVCVETNAATICLIESLAFGFTGAFRSSATGMIWMRYRWYNPILAQFLSLDPLGFAGGTNGYLYAVGDPINNVDRFGMEPSNTAKPKPRVRPKPKVQPKPKPNREDPAAATVPQVPIPEPPKPPGVPSSATEAGMQLQAIKENLKRNQTLQERAHIDRERRDRGWDEQTATLNWQNNVYWQSPWQDMVIYDMGEEVGANDVARAGTGEDERAQELSAWERIVAGVKGLAGLINTGATLATPLAAGGVVRRTGRGVLIEVESGIVRPGIRMPKALPWQRNRNARGFLRNQQKFWKWLEEEFPGLLSERNREFIRKGQAPEVDDLWIKTFPEHNPAKGDIIIHHHWQGGGEALGLPQSWHRMHSAWH
jgi:RHS repeat-associated protein